MLFAQDHGTDIFRRYHDIVFERFWKRELDIEAPEALAAVLNEAGADGSDFPAFPPNGLMRVETIGRAAEADGVFVRRPDIYLRWRDVPGRRASAGHSRIAARPGRAARTIITE
jgi:hypothetical protein